MNSFKMNPNNIVQRKANKEIRLVHNEWYELNKKLFKSILLLQLDIRLTMDYLCLILSIMLHIRQLTSKDTFAGIEIGSYISNLAFRQMVNGMFAFDKYICIKHECKVRRCYLQI